MQVEESLPAIEETVERILRDELKDLLGTSADLSIDRRLEQTYPEVRFEVRPRREGAASLHCQVDIGGGDVSICVGNALAIEFLYNWKGRENFEQGIRKICRALREGQLHERVWMRSGEIVRSSGEILIDGVWTPIRTRHTWSPFGRKTTEELHYLPYAENKT